MKNIEAIKLILKEKSDENIYTLLNNNETYNLIHLCVLNEKYLNKFLDEILNSKDIFARYNLNIVYLLSNFPKIIDKIPNNLLQKLNNSNWVKMISQQPELFDKCKIIDKFDSYDLNNILRNQPQLINKIKKIYKDKNRNTLFSYILNSKEDLNINFNYMLVSELNKNINNITIYIWLYMLAYNPDLIKICPIVDKISYNEYQNNVIDLVSKQISFKYLLPSIDKISSDHLSTLISNQPQLIEESKIDFKIFDVNNWALILSKQPQLIDKCDKLKEFNTRNWYIILSKQPKLIDYCNKIDEFNGYNWYLILKKQPKLVKYCNKLDILPNWIEILKEQPQLANYCNKFDEFKGENLYDLLMKHPQLIDKCKNINNINRKYRIKLLNRYPNLLDKIRLNKIDNDCVKILYNSRERHLRLMKSYIKNNKDKKVLTDMINIYPDLKDLYTKNNLWKYVDFSKLTDNLEYSILK